MNGTRLATPGQIGLMVLVVIVPAVCGQIEQGGEMPAQAAAAAQPFPLDAHAHGYLRSYEGPALSRAAVALLEVRLQQRLLEAIPHLTPEFGGEAYLTRLDGRPLFAEAAPHGRDGVPAIEKNWANVSRVELLPGGHDLEVVLSDETVVGAAHVPGSLRLHFDAKAGHSYALLCATTGLYGRSGVVATKMEVGQQEGAATLIRNGKRLSLSVVEAPASAEEFCRNHTGFGGGGRRMCENDVRAFLKSLDKGFELERER